MTTVLRAIAARGKIALPFGLVVGIAFPVLGDAIKPWLGLVVLILLALAAMRLGPKPVLAARGGGRLGLVVLLYQVAVPLALFAIFDAVGWTGTVPLAIVLLASAASTTANINIVLLTGHDQAPALRLLVIGMAMLPLTCIPVFTLLPELGSPAAVAWVSAKLFTYIVLATAVGFALRHLFMREPDDGDLATVDGLSTIMLVVIVVGLMGAVSPALRDTPLLVLQILAIATATSLGLQVLALLLWRSSVGQKLAQVHEAVGFAVIGGNRNMALYIAALPASIIDPMLLFIGCYQIPMYLTPILLGPLYKRVETRR
ncbi:hypothetical protein [Ahrensia sp. R2A130]|uniref:hypothetical protein n=1 Tax=Ahrensia sp. R2A130 TaxID=744979 RepID=UPI0001E0D131|nr:hypothetical protein [Ahrensia sp. R2A130]EFL87907.1 putative membrane protein [Ahrensia sp. R2A130]